MICSTILCHWTNTLLKHSVIHNVAKENNSDYVTYEELVENLPYLAEGDYPAWHLTNLEENCRLIWSEVWIKENGSEEIAYYIRGIN
jgi:hypothetical protein